MQNILREMQAFAGKVSLYYKPLDGGEGAAFQEDMTLVAASVIKIPVMVEAFFRQAEGTLNFEQEITVKKEDKMPSCGALTYLHDDIRVQVIDLITLMIIVSDNTATNLLIDMLGMENINRRMEEMGIPGVWLERKLFDAEAASRGKQNRISARGVGMILEKLYRGEVVSKEASARMLGILKDQQLNGKFPFYIQDVDMAHKTGEDDGITHDAAIVYADKPFVLCMFSNEVDVPPYERLMQKAAKVFYDLNSAE